ncbi:MAG: helix-turn-helix domain-containing protein [Chloroflexi bacterium]|nr:helix-turn-helix domain-containing protein [Chloroflexota bacterium]
MVRQVEYGWSQAEVARQFRVSRATVAKYMRRYREQGESGLVDRSSRPHRSPQLTPPRFVKAICKLRRKRSWGPRRIGWQPGIPRSTVYAVLRRSGLNRLAWMHRATREVVRYEHASPGDMNHLDVKKLGRVPEGGGKRFAPGFAETRSRPRSKRPRGIDCMHVAIDDLLTPVIWHSRVVYVEALPDEKGVTTAGFLERDHLKGRKNLWA